MSISTGQMDVEDLGGGGLRLRLAGELDMTFTVAHQRVLERLVDAPPHQLEIDAADVTFVDSTGLRAFTTLATCVRSVGGDVRMTECGEAFRRLIQVTGLGERLGMSNA